MKEAFQRLLDRTENLGNHARKHLRSVSLNGGLLISRLEASGFLSRVPVDRATPSVSDAFTLVAQAGRDPRESLKLLGTYYSTQYLHLCSRALERLAVDLAEGPDPKQAYRHFVRRAEEEFTSLSSAYIRRTLKVLSPPNLRAPYVICAVGTRGHQDDIDVAIIDEGGPHRPEIDGVMAKLTVQMLRHASAFDHYLAERIGAEKYAISPGELSQKLHRGRLDFVVVTELMRAEPLVGNRSLYTRLLTEVIQPFMYREGEDNSRHELYLRSLLGEIRSLLLRPCPPGSINPKDDALRLIMALTLAFKTIHSLPQSRTRDLLKQLGSIRPDLRGLSSRLARSLFFLETLRHIAQLLIAQEEQIDVVSPGGREQLLLLAQAMGYRDDVGVRADDHLLVHYHEAVRDVRETTEPLMDAVAKHLRKASRFALWTSQAAVNRPESRPALEFAAGARAFRGIRFWDDLLEVFADPDSGLLDAFIRDYSSRDRAQRKRLCMEYAEWGRHAPYALLSLIVLIHTRPVAKDRPVTAREMAEVFVEHLGKSPEDVRAMSRVFRFYPGLANAFLLVLNRTQLSLFLERLESPIGDSQVAAARDRFQDLIRVHRRTSRYIKRVLRRLTTRRPATIQAIANDSRLSTLAQGRLAAAERHLDREKQKNLLGDFYDMEFLRISLNTLRGQDSEAIRDSFHQMTETYLQSIFDICLRQVEHETGSRLLKRDRFGIFLTGGYARRRPYDEDFDLIALIDTTDRDDRLLAEKAVVKLNRQIARRGVIAQYHLGERFGHFVVSMDELHTFLSNSTEDFLVDHSQLLGSRMVAGSRRVETALLERILGPHIFSKSEHFVTRISREIRERRQRYHPLPEGYLHLKESPGGLREIDLAFAAAKARLQVYEPEEEVLTDKLGRLDPSRAELYKTLRSVGDFLVEVRSAYRVSVAASDVVEYYYLSLPTKTLGIGEWNGVAPEQRLFDRIQEQLATSIETIDQLLEAE